jgi:hypothetical protein
MNDKIYERYAQYPMLAVGEKKKEMRGVVTIDLDGADINVDINKEKPVEFECPYFLHIRAGEILEHLTDDYGVLVWLRRLLHPQGTLLITVPFYGEAPYHVRLHNDCSIRRLLRVAGFDVVEYIPRKAPRLDRLIYYLRVFGPWVNYLFYRLNHWLPIKPNGGYYFCIQCEPSDIIRTNYIEFKTTSS